MKNNDQHLKKVFICILSVTAFALLLTITILYLRGSKSPSDSTADADLPAHVTESDIPAASFSDTPVTSFSDAPAAESIVITAPSEYIIIGSSMELHAETLPSASNHNNLKWSSSDSSVATVSESGTVTAVSKGQVYISVRTDTGINSFIQINVIDHAVIYISPSSESTREYPVGNTNESEQSKIISGYCKEKLTAAGLNVLICEDDGLSVKAKVKDAKKEKADYYISIHTANTTKDGAQVYFIRHISESSRMSLYVKDSLASIIETEEKGTVLSGLNFDIKELEYAAEIKLPALVIEAQSHKTAENAQWIIDNQKEIGYSIADGIMDFLLNNND